MVVEWAQARCTDPECDWGETQELADEHAEWHANETGHRVELTIHAHVGTAA